MMRAPRDGAAGLLLVALASIAYWQAAGLSAGAATQLGPGMLPRALAVLIALCGLVLMVGAIRAPGHRLGRWHLRGPVLILGAALAFAASVRPLGLLVAGPLAVLIGALASRETRWAETFVFAAILTIFCLGLFRFALNLPIPVAPWLIGY